MHLMANPGYSQFIVGDNVAIVAVYVESARICDVKDRVRHWQHPASCESTTPSWPASPWPEPQPGASPSADLEPVLRAQASLS